MQRLRLEFSYHRQIKDIARCKFEATMPNLFCHDFSGGFYENAMIEQCLDMGRFLCERRSGHEVDFAFGENEFDIVVVFNIFRGQRSR